MPGKLQITSATISRFHSFEAAAQFERRGALVAIYTGLARRFVRRYPIAADHIRTFPWLQTPLEAAQRLHLIPRRWEQGAGWYAKQALDRHVARTLPDCHVYCALSGVGLASGRVARARGLATVCDRGSSHIVYQDRVLREEYEALGLPYAGIDPRVVEKECAEYAEADAVLVQSTFAHRSFVEMGTATEKLRLIPLGVDISSFRRTTPRDTAFNVLFVGQLSVRKGLHHLLQAFDRASLDDATLVLAGPAWPETDALLQRFPAAGVERTGPLSRKQVVERMSRASVFVLPSIEEGFGMVMAEALGCGCPVIATASTGGADLFTDGAEGFIVPTGDVEAMADRLVRLHDDPALLDAMTQRALARVRGIGGWDSYGRAALRTFTELARAAGHDVAAPGDMDG